MYLKHKAFFIGIVTIFLLSSAEAAGRRGAASGILPPPVSLYEAYCGGGRSDSEPIQIWLDEAIADVTDGKWTKFDNLVPTEKLLAAAKARAVSTDLTSVEYCIFDELERLWSRQAEKVARHTVTVLSGRCSMSGRVSWNADQIKAMQQLLAVLTAA